IAGTVRSLTNTIRGSAPDSVAGYWRTARKLSSDQWQILTPRHKPEDSLAGHLTLLKWEGVNLNILAALFKAIPEQEIARCDLKLQPECTCVGQNEGRFPGARHGVRLLTTRHAKSRRCL